MRFHYRGICALLAATSMFALGSCSEDTTTSPATKAKASFTVADTVSEGTVVTFTNSSSNATSYRWYSVPAGMNSTLASPTYTFDSAGTYMVYLIATGSGGSDTAMKQVVVKANYMWRATDDSSKTWSVTSLTVNGNETVALPCHQDNTLRLSKTPTMTFELSEGTDICPSQAQVLPPQSGSWTLSADGSEIALDITQPFTSTITYQVVELTPTRAKGTTTVPGLGTVVITLEIP